MNGIGILILGGWSFGFRAGFGRIDDDDMIMTCRVTLVDYLILYVNWIFYVLQRSLG